MCVRIDNDAVLGELHPHTPSRLEFWGAVLDMKASDFKVGDKVYLKTKGNGPIIETISKSELRSNYAGEDVGTNWGDKIAQVKAPRKTSTAPEVEGVDDDEWDDE